MKKCKVSGWKGTYSERGNLIATNGSNLKLYNSNTHELLFQSKGLRYLAGSFFNKDGSLLWAHTTENWVYAIDTKSLEFVHKFRVKPGKEYKFFELDSAFLSDNERYLLMTGFYCGGMMIMAYDLNEDELCILQKSNSQGRHLLLYTDNHLNIIDREIGLKGEGDSLICSSLKVHNLPGDSDYVIENTFITDIRDKKLWNVLYLTEDRKYMLCRVYGRGKKQSPIVVYDTEESYILLGDFIPDLDWEMQAYFYAPKKTFIIFCAYEVWSVTIKYQEVGCRRLLNSDYDIGDCLLIDDNVLILRERSPSYLVGLTEEV